MEYVFLILIIIIIITVLLLSRFLSKPKPSQQKPKPKPISEYDSEGYNEQGYNEVGKNRQGKYNRYYNVKCYKTDLYSEEGFLNVRNHQLYITKHAQMRMKERMDIDDLNKMKSLAFDAFQFGKSKYQLMKSERAVIEEKEQEYDDCIILIYRGFCYVFTENIGLKTVYKNDKIRA